MILAMGGGMTLAISPSGGGMFLANHRVLGIANFLPWRVKVSTRNNALLFVSKRDNLARTRCTVLCQNRAQCDYQCDYLSVFFDRRLAKFGMNGTAARILSGQHPIRRPPGQVERGRPGPSEVECSGGT
jgi:hypothetical protein